MNTIRQHTRLNIEQREPVFSQSCLPITSEMANICKPILDPVLLEMPNDWHYNDKVLVYLVPSLRIDVENFYSDKKKSLADIFANHQIKHLDQTIFQQLYNIVEQLFPSFADALKGIAELKTKSP